MIVKFKRVRPYRVEKYSDAVWEYTIEEADVNVYGCAGGMLSRTPNGHWVASYYGRATGAPAATRLQAIANVIPLAQAVVQQWDSERQAYNAKCQRREEDAETLRAEFVAAPNREVSVYDITVKDATSIKEPPNYTVTVEYKNLTAEQVKAVAYRLPGRILFS